eukprot:TRINITY_DN32055_c0_g1_i1.p1 TRINITY_DN32055_c0_g1~~TRINITY_DN32055_c0_g1_i1.p1  ORF type:complete len:270 (+),score=52.23 TRINITY_DN32055_c0_g1_i1:128-937(+)
MSGEGAPDAFTCLTPKALRDAEEKFKGFSRDEKIQCLLSIALLKSDYLKRYMKTMHSIIEQAESDHDQWVQGLARLLLGFPATSIIQCSQTDQEFVYKLAPELQVHVVPYALLPFSAEVVTPAPGATPPWVVPREAPRSAKDPEELFDWLAEDFEEQRNYCHQRKRKQLGSSEQGLGLLARRSSGQEKANSPSTANRASSRARSDFMQSWRADERAGRAKPAQPRAERLQAAAEVFPSFTSGLEWDVRGLEAAELDAVSNAKRSRSGTE